MCFDFYFLVGPNFSSGWRDNLKQKKMRFFRSGWFFGELRELTAPPWSPWLEFQSQTIEFEGKIYRRINGVFNRFTDQATLFKNYITFWNNDFFDELKNCYAENNSTGLPVTSKNDSLGWKDHSEIDHFEKD